MAEDKKATKEEIEEGLKLLAASREKKAKEKARRDSPEYKAKQTLMGLKQRLKGQLLQRKAVAAGIVVTEAEIQAEIKKRGI